MAALGPQGQEEHLYENCIQDFEVEALQRPKKASNLKEHQYASLR